MPDILDHDGEARRTGAAKDAADKEDAVTLVEHVGEGLELVAVLDFVQSDRTNVRRTDEADVHLVLKLVVGKQQRSQCLIGLVHGVIADKVAELLPFHCTKVEDEGVVELDAALAHNLFQGDEACGEETVGIDRVPVEPLAQTTVGGEQSLGAFEVLIALVWVDDDRHNFDIGHRTAVLVNGTHTRRRQHNQRLQHPRTGATYCK